MTTQEALQIKEKIISLLRVKGPSLPVHISSATGISILFAGAFLSELISDKRIRISDMKVGSSPVYYLPGQEGLLDRYSQHLKSKERDAYELLRSKKFLHDKTQDPAIRVALRAIKDFAVPFEKNSDLYWRFHTFPQNEFDPIHTTPKPHYPQRAEEKAAPEIKEPQREIVTLTFKPKEKAEEEKTLSIFERKSEQKETKKPKPQKTAKKPIKKSSKKEEGLFNKVKELLAKKSIEILDIEDIKNGEITLKVSSKGKEELLIAYNKKKISESDILKAHKKAQGAGLPYMILSLGEAPKKTQSLIDAVKSLSSIEKL